MGSPEREPYPSVVELDALDDADFEPDAEPLEAEPAIAGASVIDAIKAARARVGADRHFDHPVPGTYGLLVLRFGSVTPSQQTDLSNRIVASRGRQLPNANLDTLVAAYRCALGRVHVDDELAVITGDAGEPASLKELVVILGGEPPPSTRAALRLLFAGANSAEIALQTLGNEWNEWASGESEEAAELMGES
jgi:hypothetical protein